jgi:hypothetical protein
MVEEELGEGFQAGVPQAQAGGESTLAVKKRPVRFLRRAFA